MYSSLSRLHNTQKKPTPEKKMHFGVCNEIKLNPICFQSSRLDDSYVRDQLSRAPISEIANCAHNYSNSSAQLEKSPSRVSSY